MTSAESTPYLIDDQPKQPWFKTKAAKLTAAIVGGAIVLGATFAGGVAIGAALGPQLSHELGIHPPFDRDGDHKGFNPDGDQDGFNPAPNQPNNG